MTSSLAQAEIAEEEVAEEIVARPFVKYAGGKTKLLPVLRARLPEHWEGYHEPFVGGGALFWDLARSRRLRKGYVSLSDANPMLIRTYRAVKEQAPALVEQLRAMPVTKEHFMSIRSMPPERRDALSDVELAAWFVYLNKTAFNGVFRVNQRGIFNVPFGQWPKPPTTCDAPNLLACQAVLRNLQASITERGFETSLSYAQRGDLVYFDPPYLPTSKTADFTSYTKEGFRYEDHVRLRDVALELKERGVHVLISNSDVPLVRELYESRQTGQRFHIDVVEAPRSVNVNGKGRGCVRELVIR